MTRAVVVLAAALAVTTGCGGDGDSTTTAAEPAEAATILLPGGWKLFPVAGNGTDGFAGSGGPATRAQLNLPAGLAWDAAGNLYIGQDYRLSKVDAATGVITTIAGTGVPGYSGDGGPATKAKLGRLQELAVDAEGNLYFADWGSDTIRRIDGAGVITTVIGTGESGFSPDGTPGTKASLSRPFGVAFGPDGRLYFSDGDNHRVRRLEPDGTVTTIAGNGDACEEGDGGPATKACLLAPRDIAFDAEGNLYIGTHGGSRIRMVDTKSIITSVAEETVGQYVAPDFAGNLYIGRWPSDVQRWTTDGRLQPVLRSGKYGEVALDLPGPVAVGPDGSVYVTETGPTSRVYRVERAGEGRFSQPPP